MKTRFEDIKMVCVGVLAFIDAFIWGMVFFG